MLLDGFAKAHAKLIRNFKMRKIAFAVLLLFAAAPVCVAQLPVKTGYAPQSKGFSSYTSFEQTHDSASNWSSVIDSSVSYDFNKVFGISLGIPFYLAHNEVSTSTTTLPGTTTQTPLTAIYNQLGDVRFGLKFATPTPVVRYVATITGTAPTGDTSTGISTGRAGADFNNHFEFDLGPITPLAEVGIANSNALINSFIKRPYTTLGALSHFRGGIGLPLGKNLSLEFSGYENLPVGIQKLYSHLYGKKSGSTPGGPASVVTGTGISEDNGFTTGLNASLGGRMDFSFGYDHSVNQQLNTVAFGVGIRLGKPAPK
jgi:hypothetical protein